MTTTLKKQLSMLCAATILGGALGWNGGILRAQDEAVVSPLLRNIGPRRALSRDQAAKSFAALLHYAAQPPQLFVSQPLNDRAEVLPANSPYAIMVSSLSQRSLGQMGDQTEKLLVEMAAQWKRPPQSPRPLVLIEEKGAWGVDLIETYAKWNNLQGQKKAVAIYELTGFELPQLPTNGAFSTARENERRASCQSNLKQIALGVAQYTQDYDELYPLAPSWTDRVLPYVKGEQIFTCPSLPKGRKYGYAYNSKLSKQGEFALDDRAKTVEFYETTFLKRSAFGTGENRAFRHLGGANYAFTDGHVKWFPKTQTPSFNLNP